MPAAQTRGRRRAPTVKFEAANTTPVVVMVVVVGERGRKGEYENVDIQLTLLNSLQAWESAAPAAAVVSLWAVI